MNNIYNIPRNYNFFESLFFWLEANFGDLSQPTVILPNRRSCRELHQLFLQKKSHLILPKIKAISDISYEDFFDFDDAQTSINFLLEKKVLEKNDYLFFLSSEIKKLQIFGQNLDFLASYKIAQNLYNLFEEIEREEIDLKKLYEIDDSNLSKHRQLTLEFLQDFYVKIKNSLIKNNINFAAANHNLVINEFIKYNYKNPLVIAGSTGSMTSSQKLIKAISTQENGYVILYGLNCDEFSDENHAQFFLNRLLSFLEINRSSVKEIALEKFILSPKKRQNFISAMMLPAVDTIAWQKELDDEIKNDIKENFTIIESKNEIEEAKVIALILKENIAKKSALISNNDNLANLVKLELTRLNLEFNDSRNLGIFNSKLINFLLQILEINGGNFSAAALLALLKNPLCFYAKEKQKIINFEINVLREERKESAIDISSFNEITFSLKEKTLANLSLILIQTAEKLSKKSWNELLLEEPAQTEIFDFFEKLKLKNDIILDGNYLEIFKNLFKQISFFDYSNPKAPIQILSTIEARLLNYDLVIIGALNEGDFPQIETQNYLGKKIKKDLGVDRALRKLGQNAFDFCNYMSNKKVVLSRAKSKTVESPFLLKFKTLCQKNNIKVADGNKYFSYLHNFNNLPKLENRGSNPKPEIDLRPKTFSITEINKLLTNPYAIYAKKILQLKELQKIDFESSYAEFGSFVHEALEQFIKNPEFRNFEKIFEKYFINEDAKLIWFPKFKNIFENFYEENLQFENLENHVEIPVKLAFDKVTIKGKIDRVIIDKENFAHIFDYKTGQVPSKKDVESGINPQLTISALALLDGIIESKLKNLDEVEIASLNYWKVGSNISEIKKICKNNEEVKILVAAAKSGLARLFDYFYDEKNGFIAKENDDEYWHLGRIK